MTTLMKDKLSAVRPIKTKPELVTSCDFRDIYTDGYSDLRDELIGNVILIKEVSWFKAFYLAVMLLTIFLTLLYLSV